MQGCRLEIKLPCITSSDTHARVQMPPSLCKYIFCAGLIVPPVVFPQHIKWNVSIICELFYLISTTVPKGKEGKEAKSFALLLFVFTFRSIILGDLSQSLGTPQTDIWIFFLPL